MVWLIATVIIGSIILYGYEGPKYYLSSPKFVGPPAPLQFTCWDPYKYELISIPRVTVREDIGCWDAKINTYNGCTACCREYQDLRTQTSCLSECDREELKINCRTPTFLEIIGKLF